MSCMTGTSLMYVTYNVHAIDTYTVYLHNMYIHFVYVYTRTYIHVYIIIIIHLHVYMYIYM